MGILKLPSHVSHAEPKKQLDIYNYVPNYYHSA